MNQQIESLWTCINLENNDIKKLIDKIDKFEITFSEAGLSADERAIISLIRDVGDRLYDVKAEIDYYNSPITFEGKLHKTKNDRYAVGEKELDCGHLLEFFKEDSWIKSRMECKDRTYYLLRHDGLLEGLVVRVREKTR